MATAPHSPAEKQTSVIQLYKIPVLVSSGTVFEFGRLAASCAPVPGLSPVVEVLQKIYDSVQQVYWNKSQCLKLSTKAMIIVTIICNHYDSHHLDKSNLRSVVDRTVNTMLDIDRDVQEWAALSSWRSWYLRHEVAEKIEDHQENLRSLTEYLSLATVLQFHYQVLALQESIRNSLSGSPERKRAEEQLYRLRSATRGELSELTPPELVCECVRLGVQPEFSGTRNDVWKGRLLDREDVALIFYKEYKMGKRDLDGIRQFERQVRLWRKLKNPFVLRLYGWCQFDEETYLVSPWMHNGDVLTYLNGGSDRHRKCISLIVQIARGLVYLHNLDIMHGSLKPSNILINNKGEAVLSDFSLAKPAAVGAKNTQLNPQINVFRYQSPEVISDEPISKASDVYSWAMTALEIITGEPPFHTWPAPGQLIRHISENNVPARSDYKSPVLDEHPEIWELFVQCWSREPTNRPTMIKVPELIEGIRGIL